MKQARTLVSCFASVATLSVASLSPLFSFAQSSVTLYGQADAFVGRIRSSDGGRRDVVGSGGMQTSYWGIRGAEDLGGGLSAVFDLNAFYRVDTGKTGSYDGEAYFARNSYVGLNHIKYGSLTLGRNTTPYFVSTILFNPLIDSYVFGPAISHTYLPASNRSIYDPGVIGDTGWVNSVMYTTPSFSGLTFSLIAAAREDSGSSGQNKVGGNFMYFNGAFAATGAYQRIKVRSDPSDVVTTPAQGGVREQRAAQVGVSYDFGVARIYFQGQAITSEMTGLLGDLKHRDALAGVSVPISAGNLLISYARGRVRNELSMFRRSTVGVAYDYNLSKRTDIYIAYYHDKLSEQGRGSAAGLGIRHKF